MARKVILDCDSGHDDAVAMVLAHGNPGIDLLGVTTVVAGNRTVATVARNALSVATVIGMTDVPIAVGCPRPLVRNARVAAHGGNGMEGTRLPEPATPLDPRHAVDLIVDTVMALDPGEITLVATGALTNIALAARKSPAIVNRVREVVLMGGGYHEGNWSPVAEYNIKNDPEAAHIVFNEVWPVTMVGLDLTHQALATPKVLEQVHAVGTPTAHFVLELLQFLTTSTRDKGFQFPPVHDPCAVAYVIDQHVMTVRRAPVDIELSGTLTLGMTVADLRANAAQDCHTQVAVKLDHQLFWELVVDALERIGQVQS